MCEMERVCLCLIVSTSLCNVCIWDVGSGHLAVWLSIGSLIDV